MYSGSKQRSNGRTLRARSGGPRRSRTAFSQARSRRGFSGNAISIDRFISKAATLKAETPYVPEFSFADFAIDESIKKVIARRGFVKPMPIQDRAIGHILAGKDVVGLANTGTGKTGAFLIPMIDKMLKNSQEKLLIVVPTRELAIQIQEEFAAFTQGMRMGSVVVVGGASIYTQIMQLRNNPRMVVGTPGRLKDLISRKNLNLSAFKNVVLDEADQMLDKGFFPDIKLLLSMTARERQTLFFSATLSAEIERLVNDFLRNPITISIQTKSASASVEQDIVRVNQGEDKVEILHELLIQASFQKVLIFTRTKFGAEKLSNNLYQRGFKTESIHGDKTHGRRLRALKMFKENYVEILVATDIAARGLDIPNVSHVINFDAPATYEDYIHRIGRTGRADKKGIALTFVG